MSTRIERHRRGVPAAAILLLLAVPRLACAQGYPVVDSAAIAEATDTLNAAAQQVQQLNAMLAQVQSIADSLGKQGLPAVPFQQTLSQSGVGQYAPAVAGLLTTANSGAGATGGTALAGVLSQLDGLKGATATTPDFSSFTSTQTWVKNELTVGKDANLTTVNLARKARGMLAGEAAATAYAMALNARQQVAGMAARTQKLAQQASGATDLRGDVAANTAVMLAMHDEIAAIQALMAGLLEVQSAARLAEMDPTLSSAAAAASSN